MFSWLSALFSEIILSPDSLVKYCFLKGVFFIALNLLFVNVIY